MGSFDNALKKYAEYVIKKAKDNLAKGGKYGSQDKSGALSNSCLLYTSPSPRD